MNLIEIWKEDTILDAGGNRSARRKPARASMDREPNSHTTLTRLGIEPGPHWWKAREQPLRQPARPKIVHVLRGSSTVSKTIGGKLVGFSSVKDVDLIQSVLKSVPIYSYYWLFLGKIHIESMLYALTQPERELLSNRYVTRTTQHMHYPLSHYWPMRSL